MVPVLVCADVNTTFSTEKLYVLDSTWLSNMLDFFNVKSNTERSKTFFYLNDKKIT